MQVATGFGEHVDAHEAARRAAEGVRAQLPEPDFLLCFASVQLDHAEVLSGIQSVLGRVPLLGGTSGATITEAGWRKRGIALLGVKADGFRFALGLGRQSDVDSYRSGIQAARQVLDALRRPPKVLLPIPASVIACDHPAFLAGLQEVLPGTFMVGGASAMDGMLDPSHPLFLKSFQYWNDEVHSHVTPVLALDWDDDALSDAFACGHGFMPIGLKARVTGSEGKLVRTIDGAPAGDFFRRYLGEQFDFRVDAAMATLGLVEEYEGGRSFTRVNPTLQPGPEDSIAYIMEVPPGREVQIVRTTRTELIQAARQTVQELRDRLAGKPPRLILMFSCGGRHALLGDRCREELAALQAVFGPEVPVIGLQAGGEFAPIAPDRHGHFEEPAMYGQWHNYSLVLYALA